MLLFLHASSSSHASVLIRQGTRTRSPLCLFSNPTLPVLALGTLCMLCRPAGRLAWYVDAALQGLVWQLCPVASHCCCSCLSQLQGKQSMMLGHNTLLLIA